MSTLSNNNSLSFSWFIYATTFLLMTIASPAIAQFSNAQQAREKEAKKACLAGKNSYEQGIEILAELFAITNEPTYIYNQGRCYQQNNQPDLALSRFQEYLRKDPKMTPKEKATLEKYMKECADQIAKNQPPTTVAAPPTPQPVKVAELPEPVATQTVISPVQEPTTHSGRGLRIAGVTMTAIGFLTLGGAATFHWLHNEKEKDFKEGEVWTNEKQSRSNLYKNLAVIGYGIGAATVTTGIILSLVGWNSGKTEEPNFVLVHSLYPGEVTFSLRGVF
jgi:tetratricopeptide (TPR) repeat protein